MTITFENESDVIVYALEKIISYARKTQHIFAANCVWWLASIIGLESGLIVYIDTLKSREEIGLQDRACEDSVKILRQNHLRIHPDRIEQISRGKSVSATPRDLTEDQRLDQVLDSAEKTIQYSVRDRLGLQQNLKGQLSKSKNQLKKARRAERRQKEIEKQEEARRAKLRQKEIGKQEAARNQRLQNIRATVVQNLSKE